MPILINRIQSLIRNNQSKILEQTFLELQAMNQFLVAQGLPMFTRDPKMVPEDRARLLPEMAALNKKRTLNQLNKLQELK